ncbi:hypothetical protein [Bacillus sp. EB01]|uniref:hypothetical protein n=1 Tax=Bacillus sp. EB01 TaxID=1347086 RepID=UPI0005C5822E|nr:hypothetical protein [Bacillus sp. EB01]
MDKVEKVKVAAELFELVQFYYVNRDRPVTSDMDFYAEVKRCCEILDLDYNEFINEFKLKF